MSAADAEAGTGERSPHLFSADRPISSRSEDLLGRAPFAEHLAKAIEGWRQKDSLVMALYGPWGVGKTSLKNLVVEQPGGRLAVVEFNPWQWSAQDRIAQAFFEHLARGIAWSPARGFDRLRARWVAIRVRNYARLLNVAAAGLGLAGRIGVLLASLVSPDTRPGLARAKARLAELLRKLDRPVLVVIDDIDRLTAEEIRLVFQLVKANADFPNLVYLLIFDRIMVERALDQAGHAGGDFLEKIVQIGFDVPQPDRAKLEDLLFQLLDQTIAKPGVAERWDRQRWARLFLDGLRPFLETLRDVKRFVGMVDFHVSLLRGEATLEVNPIDLIGLEVLRVFEPAVYRALPSAKGPLTEVPPALAGSAFAQRDPRQDAKAQVVRSLVEAADPRRREAVKSILLELFPAAGWAFGGPVHARMERAWLRDLRVCRPELFDRYFLLSIPEGDISQAELDGLMATTGDRDAFAARLRDLFGRGVLDAALERLDANLGALDPAHAVSFVTALFDVGDELPHGATGLFDLSTVDRAHLLLRRYLTALPDAAARAHVLRTALGATEGTVLAVLTVARLRGQTEDSDSAADLLDAPDLTELEQLCLDKIRAAAANGALLRSPLLLAFLHQWERWAPGEPKVWVTQRLGTGQDVALFLRGCLTRVLSQTASEYVPEERYVIRLKKVEPFADLGRLSEAVSRLDVAALTPDERRAVEAFQRAMRRRVEKQPEDEWDDE